VVPTVSAQGGEAIRQRHDPPLQAGAESLGNTRGQANGGDLEERLPVCPAEVMSMSMSMSTTFPSATAAHAPARFRYLQRAGEVVGGAQRKDAERDVRAGNSTGGAAHGPVAATDDDQFVPV
jgi:hypothetical protein